MKLAEALKKHKPQKYRAVPTWVNSIRFASKREAARFIELKLLEKSGHISNLRLQERIKLVVNGELVCTYVADFVYHEGKTPVVEDVKGYRTDVYRLKRRLLKALHGVDIREV